MKHTKEGQPKRSSIICLNLNETEVAKDSVRIALKEGHEVILVDNGSTDGGKEYFRTIKDKNFIFIDIPVNMGISVGRNKGIDASTGENIFLLDGDILFVRGTIEEYQKVLDLYPDAGCVGQNSMELLNRLGHNGTTDPVDADFEMSKDYEVSDWFPMAWTQYGLFRGDMLRKLKFTEVPPYNESGYGCEDDWLFQDMKKEGYKSLSVSAPIYYHQAHGSYREFDRTGESDRTLERIDVFEKKWGKKQTWFQRINKGIEKTTRSNPNVVHL